MNHKIAILWLIHMALEDRSSCVSIVSLYFHIVFICTLLFS